MEKFPRNVPFQELNNLHRDLISLECSLGLKRLRNADVAPSGVRLSDRQITKAFNAAESFVCNVIQVASRPGRESMGILDLAMSAISSVRKSQLPKSEHVARKLAFEVMINRPELLDVCKTHEERYARACNILHAKAIVETAMRPDRLFTQVMQLIRDLR